MEFILNRVEHKGLTAVVGRPKMGKTWLLEEVCRQLQAKNYLTGYHECLGESDQLLRVVSNLYIRWLQTAGNLEQARIVFEQNKECLVTKAGVAVGKIFSNISELKGIPSGFGKLVEETFQGLAKADADLKSGGISIQPLPYEQAHELVSILHRISGSPLVLVFDAWEKSASLEAEHKTLAAFLSHMDEWPVCHVILGIRHPDLKKADPTDHGFELAKDLEQSKPGTALIYELLPMHLGDPLEQHNLIVRVRTQVTAAQNIEDADLLEMLQAFPGVLDVWLSEAKRGQMKDAIDMRRVAVDAQAYRYREFETLFPKLSVSERRLAIRLAVLPRLNADLWQLLNPIVLDGGLSEITVDELNLRHVLEGGIFPSYGHDTRHAAAQRWFLVKMDYRSLVVRETQNLLFKLAANVTSTDTSTVPYSVVILSMDALITSLQLGNGAGVIIASVSTLFKGESTDWGVFSNATKIVAESGLTLAPLVSMGLFNAINVAERAGNPKLRDDSLEELRQLFKAYSSQDSVRIKFANGLYNMINFAEKEKNLVRRDDLLDELRKLQQAYPADVNILERLANGLFNTLCDARGEDNYPRQASILKELRALNQTYAANNLVVRHLAESLGNAIVFAMEKGDFQQRDTLLNELRVLSQAHPADTALHELLAKRLFNIILDPEIRKDVLKIDSLLNDLRMLSQVCPDSSLIIKHLARSLVNAILDANVERDFKRRDALFEELHLLYEIHSPDVALREAFARGLINALVFAREEKDAAKWNDLLREARALSKTIPTDVNLCVEIASALGNEVIFAKNEGDFTRLDTLLDDLRGLAGQFSENIIILKSFGLGLCFKWEALAKAMQNELANCLANEIEQVWIKIKSLEALQDSASKT